MVHANICRQQAFTDKLESHAAAQETLLTDTSAVIARLQHLHLEDDAQVVRSKVVVESLFMQLQQWLPAVQCGFLAAR